MSWFEKTTEAALLKKIPPEPPNAYRFWITEAIRLEALQRSGAVFSYPDALPPEAWAAMEGQRHGRDKAEAAQIEREELKRRQEESRARNSGVTF